jgi:hypothetical protein
VVVADKMLALDLNQHLLVEMVALVLQLFDMPRLLPKQVVEQLQVTQMVAQPIKCILLHTRMMLTP